MRYRLFIANEVSSRWVAAVQPRTGAHHDQFAVFERLRAKAQVIVDEAQAVELDVLDYTATHNLVTQKRLLDCIHLSVFSERLKTFQLQKTERC